MKRYFFILLLLLLSTASCKKFVEIAAPDSQLVKSTIFSDQATANAAQLGIYSQMAHTTYTYLASSIPGLSSDEFTNYSTGVPDLQNYHNQLLPNNLNTQKLWSYAYSFIYQENSLIEGVENSPTLNKNLANELKGEALFTRAYLYFYLINLFGDVPYTTSSDYKSNSLLSNTPVQSTYDQIVSDLNLSYNLLSETYVGTDGLTASDERLRPNKLAAAALLARVYLFRKDYQAADKFASIVINDSQVHLLPDLNTVFLANSEEAIWQVSDAPWNTIEGQNFVLTATPRSVTISPQLLNSFEAGDQRKVSWLGLYIKGATSYYFPNKYKIANRNPPVTEYSMVLRLAEQYLILSEAKLAENDLPGALTNLNTVRRRAGLLDYSGPIDDNSVLQAILHERQVELFSEWGHRWLDLKRTKLVDSVMTIVTPQKGGSSWNSFQQLYPIYQTELQNDPNLKQMPGY